MRHFAIIGNPLEHSFSSQYFNTFFAREGIDANYCLCPMKDLHGVCECMDYYEGFSVTIPFKQAILPYLTAIDPIAERIGAVNVVKGHCGYNTDWIGFTRSLQPWLRDDIRQALVLGTGGVSQAVQYALQELGIGVTTVSHSSKSGALPYTAITADVVERHLLVVNCTPLGMWPNVDDCPPIDYTGITSQHVLFDCIYNPAETLFLRRGRECGARTINGMHMLEYQAQEAWKIWNS